MRHDDGHRDSLWESGDTSNHRKILVLAKIILQTKPKQRGGGEDFKGLRLRRSKDLVTSEKLLR